MEAERSLITRPRASWAIQSEPMKNRSGGVPPALAATTASIISAPLPVVCCSHSTVCWGARCLYPGRSVCCMVSITIWPVKVRTTTRAGLAAGDDPLPAGGPPQAARAAPAPRAPAASNRPRRVRGRRSAANMCVFLLLFPSPRSAGDVLPLAPEDGQPLGRRDPAGGGGDVDEL